MLHCKFYASQNITISCEQQLIALYAYQRKETHGSGMASFGVVDSSEGAIVTVVNRWWPHNTIRKAP